MSQTYAEMLRRPEWQKKRLRAMEAAQFACQECFADDKTLNVHHRYYLKNAKPWEYPDDALVCLCEGCHGRRHELTDEAKRLLGFLSSSSLEHALGYIKGLVLRAVGHLPAGESLPANAAGQVCLPIDHTEPSQGFGLGDCWNLRHIEYALKFMAMTLDRGGVTAADMHKLWTEQHEARQASV